MQDKLNFKTRYNKPNYEKSILVIDMIGNNKGKT